MPAVQPSPIPSLATWDTEYIEGRLPPNLPIGAMWSAPQTLPRQVIATQHLISVPVSELPLITPALVQVQMGGGLWAQYQSALVEGISRGLVPAGTRFRPSDFGWGFYPGNFVPGQRTNRRGWVFGLSQQGGQLINLVVHDNVAFDHFVDVLIIAGFVYVGAEIGVAAFGGEGVAADAAAGAGGAGAGASAASGAAGGAASSAAGDAAGSAAGNAASAASDVLSSIRDVVTQVKDAVSSVLTPISDTLHEVSGLVSDINENLIKPITAPITSILDNYKSLQGQLNRDLHDGITGLLRVPTDISNALTSVDATMQRTVAQLGAANDAIIRSTLAPAIRDAGLGAVDQTQASINAGLDQYHTDERDAMINRLHADPGVEDIAELEAKILRLTDKEFPIVGKIGGWIIDVLSSVLLITAYLESKHEAYSHIGRQKWPTALLGSTDVLEMEQRGILSEEAGGEELSKAGLSPDRIKALRELSRTLPAEADILDWEARKIIDADARSALFEMKGWRFDDAAKAKAAHIKLPSEATSIEWYQRGALSFAELQEILDAADWREADKARLIEMAQKQAAVGDVFLRLDREAAITADVAPASLTREAPAEVVDALGRLGMSAEVASLLWVNHYTLLGPSDAVQAWFRGYLSLPQLHACLRAAGLVQEQWQNYIDLQRPLFTQRNIPTLLKAGIITAQQAMDELRAIGYADADADRMVRWALQGVKAPTVEQADTLHGLTVSAIVQLYSAGTLERVEANDLLVRSGLGTEAASLTLTLQDVKDHAAERAAEADVVVAEALSGHFTFDQAQAQLGQRGLTTQETAKALGKLVSGLQSRTKMPSESQVLSMYKHGILTRTAAAQTLGLLGYSDSWAELLIQLQEKGANAPTTNA